MIGNYIICFGTEKYNSDRVRVFPKSDTTVPSTDATVPSTDATVPMSDTTVPISEV